MLFLRVLLLLSLLVPVVDDGSGLDPNGGRRTGGDGGCLIDPNGGCVARTDDGNGLDPNGGRRRATTDDGNGFDPHGRP